MSMRGLVLLMTIFLAQALAARAECCKCDCQQSGIFRPHLYFLPIAPPQVPATGHGIHGIYQSLGHAASALNVAHYGQSNALLGTTGYKNVASPAQYQVTEGGVENTLGSNSQVGLGSASLGIQQAIERPSLKYTPTSTSTLSGTGEQINQEQVQVSKVSTHQGNHYINIEQQISPHDSASYESVNSLEHEKGHDHHDHHGKNDYYKFEYAVNDQHTHDIKSQKEEKKGDVVQGEYSLVEDDGNVRTVKYYADWKTGFHAQVHNSKTGALG